ncbi:MAG: HupE/UreJ family protein [Sterolibacteriaceae bacterium]|uniref:HupE/UreJ family protein n=1 Tax=Candidatus Methylophosphatis roskildensis TaxID=2899263 RepID=A0A9D7E894_9PROT|nr:HupE/UreJ family protein [Candidatus Methylophosphatis roskildensis]MBK7237667.1 HupE/UreJ family protein [Sterolibacteriaceae bacterium]
MRRAWTIPKTCVSALLGAAALLLAIAADAHPLGNNTVSRQASFALSERGVAVRYRMDFAEIPTLAAADEADSDGDGATAASEWRRFAQAWSRRLATNLRLEVDGNAVQLMPRTADYRLRKGEAGLNVLLLEVVFEAPLPMAGPHRARYRDDFRPRDLGWKEVLVAPNESLRIRGEVARSDRSGGLARYPKDGSSLDELSADFEFRWLPAMVNANESALPIAAPRLPREAATAGQAANPQPAIDHAAGVAAPDAASMPVAAQTIQADDARPAEPPRDSAPHAMSSPAAFFVLGVHHIATGFDHLAFLLGLLLISPRVREAIKLVSAFTVAHSLTLILAAGHWVAPPGAWVEPAIAFTIAYVGFVAWRGHSAGHGVVLAFVFGLIHGFGFAGALAETLGDAAQGSGWLLKLLSFNLGIEALQLVIVVGALAIATRLRGSAWRAAAHSAASLAVLACGLAWLAVRLIEPAGAS